MTDVGSTDSSRPAGHSSPEYLALLKLQDCDTAIEQLEHRRISLPERAQLSDIKQRLAGLDLRTREVSVVRDQLAGEQSTLEDQIEGTRNRRSAIEERMFSGQVTAARDLQAMDEEAKHLATHITEMEDSEIVIMEALEPLEAELTKLAEASEALGESVVVLLAAIADGEIAIDEELVVDRNSRDALAAGVPTDLIARYEKLRAHLGGVGAARLVGGSCGGCHLSLPSMELDRLHKAPPDQLLTCDQCGRILVR